MLDIGTLEFASVSARSGFVLIFLLASIIGSPRGSFIQWALSIGFSSIGISMAYSDPSYPDYAPLKGMILYLILGFSVTMVWSGTTAFFGQRIDRRVFAVMLVSPGISYGTVRLLGGSSDLALAIVFAIFAVMSAIIAKLLFTRHRPYILPSQILVGGALASYSLAFVASSLMVTAKLLGYGDGINAEHSSMMTALVIDQFSSVLSYVGLLAMSMEESQARMKLIATTDALTGLANRRGIMERASAIVGAGRRRKRPMALLIADLDHFKSINDRFGHDIGDAVLREFAVRLRMTVRRQQDVVGRWGGEEFIAILHDTPLDEAMLLAKQLCLRVSEEPFHVGEVIDVTISVGLATFLEDEAAIEPAVKRADEALYEAKGSGRNRVCWRDQGSKAA